MYPEYLLNNDTQEMNDRVRELATLNEPLLRTHCQEVSCQTGTSSLAVKEECLSKAGAASALLEKMKTVLNTLSQSISQTAGVFGVKNGQELFFEVCRAIVQIEEERQRLLVVVASLSQTRRKIASCVAQTNQALHFFSLAKGAVSINLQVHYTECTKNAERAYESLKRADVALAELQNFYMTFIESHFSAFMERLRDLADLNHSGENLNGAQICALCREFLILQNRVPNVVF